MIGYYAVIYLQSLFAIVSSADPTSESSGQLTSLPSVLQYVFTDKTSLRAALNAWIADETAATTTYGVINNWDVSAITDMSGLFKDLDDQMLRDGFDDDTLLHRR